MKPHKHPKSKNPWFRITVPAELRQQFGKREIKLSLGTSDPSEVAIKTAELTAEWKQQFADERERMKVYSHYEWRALVGTLIEKLSAERRESAHEVIRALCKMVAINFFMSWGRDSFREHEAGFVLGYDPTDKEFREFHFVNTRINEIMPKSGRKAMAHRIGKLARDRDIAPTGAAYGEVIDLLLKTQCWEAVDPQIAMIEAWTDFGIFQNHEIYTCVCRELLTTLDNHCKKYSEDDRLQPDVRLFPSNEEINNNKQDLQSEVIQNHHTSLTSPNKGERALPSEPISEALKNWVKKSIPSQTSITEAKRAVGRFIDLFGDIDITEIESKHIFDFLDFLEDLPKSINHKNVAASGLTLKSYVDEYKSKNPNYKKIAPGTIKKDIGALSAILGVAENDRKIKCNHAKNIKVAGYSKKQKSQVTPRLPFRQQHLQTLFASPMFTGCKGRKDIDRTKPGPHIYQDEMYWTFLLAAVSGPRLEELGQIRIEDVEIRTTSDNKPIVAIYITGTGESQSVKTDSSVRIIVVHPNLIDIGFIEFYDRRKFSGSQMLFDLKKSSNGKWTKNLSRRLNLYIDRVVTSDSRYTWYSHRHEFSDRSTYQLSDTESRQIMGHARKRTYGLGIPLEPLHKKVEKLVFDFIDWTALKKAVESGLVKD